MAVIEIEVDNATNSDLHFVPTGTRVRGGFAAGRVRLAAAGQLALELPDGVPGQRVRIDTDAKTGAILEPLADPAAKPLRTAVAKIVTGEPDATEDRVSFAPAVKEYLNADPAKWVGWMARAVKAGYAKLTKGTLPAVNLADSARPTRDEPDSRDKTIETLTALLLAKLSPTERKELAGLLGTK